jgi:hypothetical protein
MHVKIELKNFFLSLVSNVNDISWGTKGLTLNVINEEVEKVEEKNRETRTRFLAIWVVFSVIAYMVCSNLPFLKRFFHSNVDQPVPPLLTVSFWLFVGIQGYNCGLAFVFHAVYYLSSPWRRL